MESSQAARRRGLLWASAAAVGIAFFVIPWKRANEIGTPAHSALILLSVAAVLNTGLGLGQRLVQRFAQRGAVSASPGRVSRSVQPVDWGVGALLAGFTLFGNLASAWAVQDLSPALLNVLLRSEVILVALFAWIFLQERVEGRFWVGAALAAVGLVVLQGPDLSVESARGEGGPHVAAGTGMAIAAATCFSGLTVLTRHFIARIDAVAVNAIRLWFAVGLWFLFNEAPGPNEIPLPQIGYVSLSAIAGPFLGRLCMMMSARYVEARVSVLANLTAPVLTLGMAFVLLSEWPSPYELWGGAIMMAGIALPLLGYSTRPALERSR